MEILRFSPVLLAASLSALMGCGSGSSGSKATAAGGSAADGGSNGAGATSGAGGTSSTSGAGGTNGGTSGTSGSGSGVDPSGFRRGVNPGYYGPGIDRRESAQMSVAAGASSLRTPLPEYYLNKWGDDVELADYAYYKSIGIDRIVVFLEGPDHDHSNAPAGVSDDELSHYSPKNLYQPIFLADGSVNPDNYWAKYVERVATTYGDYVDSYEVWNEPDQVGGNWQATQGWETAPPAPADLIWWNDTIFSYIRALRITHEVVQKVHPSNRVTVGGIGYGSYLSALLRYTDEPNAGAQSTDYPDTAGKYIDLVSYHYYPVFGGGSSDKGVDGLLAARDDYRTRLTAAGAGERDFLVTESGAPRYALGTYPGGSDYSASYLLKCLTLAHYEGFVGVDWFAQGDGAAPGASTDSFKYMGLYLDYSAANTVADTTLSAQGSAYAWLATWLPGSAADSAALAALALPATVRGAAFTRSAGGHLYVLWARTTDDESASASFAFPASGDVTVRTFGTTTGAQTSTQSPQNGSVALALTGMPLVVEAP